ncbi:MAG: ABC transporter permease [Eubacteriales bacterium]|nr:ABC transporter permease [Eubacteriales bacterium]
MLSIILGTVTMAAALRLAVPLILSSIGGCFGDRAGIFNIALESFMLCSAFFATLGSYYSGNPYVGVFCGILAGLGCSALFGVMVFHMGSSGMVVSIAMNLGMDAFTSFLLLNILGKRGSFMDPKLISLPTLQLPLVDKIPYVGEILNKHNLVVYFTLLAIAGTWITMYQTPFGLRLRSVGINEKAAQTTGTNVLRYKWYSVLITGFFVGIAGAILPLGGTSIFTENMSAGRGFLAVAAIMIAKGNPLLASLYSFLFAYAEALAASMQNFGIPSQLVLALPYFMTITVLLFSGIRTKMKNPSKEAA